MMKRVVITGIGVVSSIGLGANGFMNALRNGKSGISKIEAFDTTGFQSDQGGEVHDVEPKAWIRRLDATTIGRSSHFSIGAARLAIEDSGIDPQTLSMMRCGVTVGTTDGESQAIEYLTKQWIDSGPEYLDISVIRQVPADRLAVSVAREFGLRGEAATLATACAAGNYAIGHAYDMLRAGEADFMLCGGADSICRKTFTGFYRLGAIAPLACQPFDLHRKGILTGEGAAILLLEPLDTALLRGARIYAEVLGYGTNCDAKHMVAPDPDSIANCMRLAHANAGITPNDVDYISAHGTGTRTNDAVEAAAIREVFGNSPPPTSSVKSMIGHTMGAASALASAACALAIYHGFMPPTINFHTSDPDCNLDCVANTSREAELNIVQNNAFAFGGNNAIVVFKKMVSA